MTDAVDLKMIPQVLYGADKAVIYHGDAIQIIAALIEAGTRADCLVCDPPYLLTSGGASGIMRGKFDPKNYDNGGHIVACDLEWNDFMPLFYKALGERAHAYVMANNRNVQALLNSADGAGFGFHNLLVWQKDNATPNRWYMKNCEFTGMFYKGKAFTINDAGASALIKCPHERASSHPTEKPVALMEHYILNSTKPGDLVIDPFMGSGSTGIACLRTGRRFIGIELDAAIFAETKERFEKEFTKPQSRLF